MTDILAAAEQGIGQYLRESKREGRINQQQFKAASEQAFPNLERWYQDPELDRLARESPLGPANGKSPVKLGIERAVRGQRWQDLVNAFRQQLRFGTGGIRGMMGFDRESIRAFQKDFNAPILRGPNTINDVVLLLTSAGVAKFGRDQSPAFSRVVVGYDSRVHGADFAVVVASLFLAYGYRVYLFDEPCPYPEVTFAIPDKKIRADVGIFLSASHNDYRYNGYKLSCGNGSQFDPEQRDEMYEKYIQHATLRDVTFLDFASAARNKLAFLGGAEPVEGFDYAGREDAIINIHQRHCRHMTSFLLTRGLANQQRKSAEPLRIGYCAFHGAGRKAVPRLLHDAGFQHVLSVTERGLNDLNGLFPCFSSAPGQEEQPDPGDPKAADTAVRAFQKEYPGEFQRTDLLIGTDPDADRCGVVAKVPKNQRQLFDGKDYTLLPADDLWALVVWYRLMREMERAGSDKAPDADKKFIVYSHTTSDCLLRVAQKFGLGAIRTWVGFAALAAGVRDVWEKKPIPRLSEGRSRRTAKLCHPFACEYIDMANGRRSINVAAMEQSNGFSILGGPPPDNRSLGEGGHVRDKDGTFAALLAAEIAAWAKQQGTTLMELLDQRIFLDPDIGLFVTRYEPDPLIGEYPGIEGDRKKLDILRRALKMYTRATGSNGKTSRLKIARLPVVDACIYRTGKYDRIYPPSQDFEFPDEGVRFYFDEGKFNHVTIRPSGTGNSLRFHVQLHADVTEANLVETKAELRDRAKNIVDDVRDKLQAPRE